MTSGRARTAIRVLIADNDAAQRARLTRVLQHDRDIVVIGQPSTAAETISLVADTRPHVVVLDMQLPDGGGQHAIEQIMARTPTPILILSARIEDRSSPSAVEALVAGALDALPRPASWTPDLGAALRRTVRQISKVHVIRHPRGGLTKPGGKDLESTNSRRPVIAVAASTGGPSAIATLLSGLGGLSAPVLVVQHLHPDFTDGLVAWMSRVSALPVSTAEHLQALQPGRVYFAPGGVHLRLTANLRLALDPAPETIHRPSADELFQSVAEHAGSRGVGVLLTGMGEDGAKGLLAIRQHGGRTLAQDEATSAVFGMPKAAARIGAVTDLMPIDKLAAGIRRAAREVSA